jgi:hypothetical protein
MALAGARRARRLRAPLPPVLEPGRGPEEDKDKEDKVREMRRKK